MGAIPTISTKYKENLTECTLCCLEINTTVKGIKFSSLGMTSFDGTSNTQTATSEATDLISANKVNANDEVYDIRLAA